MPICNFNVCLYVSISTLPSVPDQFLLSIFLVLPCILLNMLLSPTPILTKSISAIVFCINFCEFLLTNCKYRH
jgi:hypothetical protein